MAPIIGIRVIVLQGTVLVHNVAAIIIGTEVNTIGYIAWGFENIQLKATLVD